MATSVQTTGIVGRLGMFSYLRSDTAATERAVHECHGKEGNESEHGPIDPSTGLNAQSQHDGNEAEGQSAIRFRHGTGMARCAVARGTYHSDDLDDNTEPGRNQHPSHGCAGN